MNKKNSYAGYLLVGLGALLLLILILAVACAPKKVAVPNEQVAVVLPPEKVAIVTPPEKVATVVPAVAVVVPAEIVTPGVPKVIFIGITTVDPLDLAKAQGLYNNIIVTFTEAMDPTTVNANTFIVKGPDGVPLRGVITADSTNKVWTFNPTDALLSYNVYDIMITKGAKGISGNSLENDFIWSFTSRVSSSGGGGGGSSGGGGSATTTTTTAPTTTTTTLASPVLTTIIVSPTTASIAIGNKTQLNITKFDQFGDPIAATITYNTSNASIATVNSSGAVTAVAIGSATITALSGSVSNTSAITVTSVCPGQTAVNLGTAANFAILSKAQITNVPTSAIVGNVGASPITGASIHVTCPQVIGTVYDVNAAYTGDGSGNTSCLITNSTLLGTAIGDMGVAYTNASARVNCIGSPDYLNEGASGELGGLTLYPGIHKWTTDVTIGVTTPGSVTLDCQGNSSAVFIMQISGKLDVGSDGSVPAGNKVLLTDCQAKNIFWAVSGITTIGTYGTFEGNILTTGTSSIALQTDAVLHGRALSDGEVTLQSNSVTKPT